MKMENMKIRNYQETDLPELASFFNLYLEKYPDAKLNSPEFYTYHPLLKEKDNAFCMVDADQKILGFAPMFPVLITDGPAAQLNDIWTIILACPEHKQAEAIHEMLFVRVCERVDEFKSEYHAHQIRLASDMMVSQKADIDYLLGKGFKPFERMFVMNRDTSQGIPSISMPDGVVLRQSKLESEEEQSAYLKVYNASFPQNQKSVEDLKFLLHSPIWETGCALCAYSASNELIGSILVYPDGQNNAGIVDDVMVLPAWQGRKIAKYLVGEGLCYLRTQNLPEARLEVRASNIPAVSVYEAMGYKKVNEEYLLEKML